MLQEINSCIQGRRWRCQLRLQSITTVSAQPNARDQVTSRMLGRCELKAQKERPCGFSLRICAFHSWSVFSQTNGALCILLQNKEIIFNFSEFFVATDLTSTRLTWNGPWIFHEAETVRFLKAAPGSPRRTWYSYQSLVGEAAWINISHVGLPITKTVCIRAVLVIPGMALHLK